MCASLKMIGTLVCTRRNRPTRPYAERAGSREGKEILAQRDAANSAAQRRLLLHEFGDVIGLIRTCRTSECDMYLRGKRFVPVSWTRKTFVFAQR